MMNRNKPGYIIIDDIEKENITNESPEEKANRIKELSENFERWIKHYFPIFREMLPEPTTDIPVLIRLCLLFIPKMEETIGTLCQYRVVYKEFKGKKYIISSSPLPPQVFGYRCEINSL